MTPIEASWQARGPLSTLLLPLSWLFYALSRMRYFGYRQGLLRTERLGVPVLVVGNITVGGSGKTPLVVALVERLRAAGYTPGVISRGYGGVREQEPLLVSAKTAVRQSGDEPLLIALRTGAPVAVGRDRVAVGRHLLRAHPEVDIVISDDGLQHYRLERDFEIAVVDGERRYANGRLLPAGPLREPLSRLSTVDWQVANGAAQGDEVAMRLVPRRAERLDGAGAEPIGLLGRCHAVAGIGHPRRFFDTLRSAGAEPIEHPFPDHHPFTAKDLEFADDLQVVMTEKDAVKCRQFASAKHWYLPVEAELSEAFWRDLLARLVGCERRD